MRYHCIRIKPINKNMKRQRRDKVRYMFSCGICQADLLVFGLVVFLGHGLNLKMDLEERKLSLSTYKIATKARTQVVMTMMGRGSFPLGYFIIPEGIMGDE